MNYTLSARRRLNEKSQNVVVCFDNSAFDIGESVSIMKQWCEKVTLFDGIYEGIELTYNNVNILGDDIGDNDGNVADIYLVVCTNKAAGLPNIISMDLKQVGITEVSSRVFAEFAKLGDIGVYSSWQIINATFIIREMEGEM